MSAAFLGTPLTMYVKESDFIVSTPPAEAGDGGVADNVAGAGVSLGNDGTISTMDPRVTFYPSSHTYLRTDGAGDPLASVTFLGQMMAPVSSAARRARFQEGSDTYVGRKFNDNTDRKRRNGVLRHEALSHYLQKTTCPETILGPIRNDPTYLHLITYLNATVGHTKHEVLFCDAPMMCELPPGPRDLAFAGAADAVLRGLDDKLVRVLEFKSGSKPLGVSAIKEWAGSNFQSTPPDVPLLLDVLQVNFYLFCLSLLLDPDGRKMHKVRLHTLARSPS
jgi:hypothetical protein